ncbi:MAG: pyrroline-5-carboxylate reductase [Chitinophagales bacterium]|nr:pyrroline-5-carboxylate reductase [Chitinophagales bacterium]
MKKNIAILGCGNLGQSIAKGLISDDFNPAYLTLSKRHYQTLDHFKQQGISVTSDNRAAVENSRIIIIAVKPFNFNDVLEDIKSVVTSDHTIVSVATGVTIKEIASQLPNNINVIRAMPNTATDVGESVTAIAYNKNTDNDAVAEAKEIFQKIGITIDIDEELMEAATILGACGIAYVMRFIRAMVQGGIQIGFNAKTASDIVNQTVKGAAALLIEREQHPEFEIDKVTTPRGCTIVGLNEMEHHGFSSSLIRGIVASYQKIEKTE